MIHLPSGIFCQMVNLSLGKFPAQLFSRCDQNRRTLWAFLTSSANRWVCMIRLHHHLAVMFGFSLSLLHDVTPVTFLSLSLFSSCVQSAMPEWRKVYFSRDLPLSPSLFWASLWGQEKGPVAWPICGQRLKRTPSMALRSCELLLLSKPGALVALPFDNMSCLSKPLICVKSF